VVYPGSIERVDFGEVNDEKGFVIVTIESGKPTQIERRVIHGRRFIDKFVQMDTPSDVSAKLQTIMPSAKELDGAIFRLTMDYPRSLEPLIDEPAIRLAAEPALEFHLTRKGRDESRSRVADGAGISGMSAEEQLGIYWRTYKIEPKEMEALNRLAREILSGDNGTNGMQG
jgi:DNA repair protein SbcD/Mre11